jgi:predicted nuclease of restriction endonuclease-like RecB superfamily
MLTTPLVRVTRRRGVLTPGYVDPASTQWLTAAEGLIEQVRLAEAEQHTLGELESACEDQIGGSRSIKLLRGLVKLLLDKCEFEVASPIPPAELRRRVFERAVQRGPLDLEANVFERPTAADVLAEVAAELEVSADDVARSLYGDLREAQTVSAAKLPTAQGLLERYNVALVQAVLFRATEVRIVLADPPVRRLRQLLRFVKFHQLMHEARRVEGGLEVVLDGPASLFSATTRYGRQLAFFFPALLLQEGPWRLEAKVLWGKERTPAQFEVSQEQGLVSHYADTGAYQTQEQRWFLERWGASDRDWTLSEDTVPIELGGRGVMLPDFSFTRDGKTAHLEIVGFWRRDYLARRVEGLLRHGPGNLVLAVSRKLKTAKEDLAEFDGEVLSFANVVPVNDVLAAVERVAR